MRARWDDDSRGRGIADATSLAGGADELVAAMRETNWVAEEPDAHLVSHLDAACADPASPLRLDSWRIEEDGNLVLDLGWTGAEEDKRGARAFAFALIGSVAESASYVRESRAGTVASYDVVTGMLGDTPFAPHGHVLRLRIDLGATN